MTRALFMLPPLLVLAACAGPRRGAAARSSDDADVASAVTSIQGAKADYRISPADLLAVSVFDNEKLNRDVRVAKDGTVTLPLTGSVPVGGLTVAEAEAALSDKLRQYIRQPQVTVLIRSEGIKKVFVLGQVLKPGACDLPPEGKLTVLGAISMAGGFTPIAAPNRTRVIRKVNGQSQTLYIEVSQVTRHGHQEKDIDLLPDDIVYVPQSVF